jgi:Golgi apparatus protein 1
MHNVAVCMQVTYLQHMGVQDFRADMQLAEACRPDIDRWCAGVEPGDGRVHKCLRDNYDQLSPACK